MSILVKITFSRKFRIFLNYRLACFAKNGEKYFELKLAISCGINGSQKIALPMLIHMRLFRFLKISRET
ncbi:hypothetical protein T4B_3214 [Trichinella pseudospiralis]|uniref:Uncharacterized protein n=1 Tax=Trichinella pseudospiralis TaxID=6337 RepID=A0A0V1GQL6_TRIPS|nr:hypothetical protein T4A_8602 [Trichinella pseudospiralis]KRZ00378.1 hypothetical protein T4B_3214 [Trichinella pseudospiralis]